MRNLGEVKRIVVKVGTNLLSYKKGIDRNRIKDIVDQVAELREKGYQVLLVSSGAVGLGAKALKHDNPVKHIPLKQACAAIGQPVLMNAWSSEFQYHGILCAQVLITRSVLNNRKSFNNLRSSVMTLLELGVVPIFNENDVVSTAEIGNVFGDNDRMSAYVASKIDAELLVLLTDIDGLYTGNPKTDKSAVKLSEVSELDAQVFSYAKGAGSTFSTGGMKTKLLAAQIAQKGGCGTIIASGYEDDSLLRILQGEEIGTYVRPVERTNQRKRWIENTPSAGAIVVDDGARKALKAKKSLLPSGIKEVKGIFNEGDVIDVCGTDGMVFMKAVTNFNSSVLLQTKGHSSQEIDAMGLSHKVVFRPEDAAASDE